MFSKRLKKLRIEKGNTQKEIANYLGLTFYGYRKYEYGHSKPTFDSLIALANYFNVSLDYLVGLSDIKERR